MVDTHSGSTVHEAHISQERLAQVAVVVPLAWRNDLKLLCCVLENEIGIRGRGVEHSETEKQKKTQ